MGPFSFEEACALHGVHLRIYIGASLLGLRFLILRHVFLDREAKKVSQEQSHAGGPDAYR